MSDVGVVAGQAVDVQTIGARLAQEIRGTPGVVELWASENCGRVTIWLFTEPMEYDDQRPLYAAAGVLRRLFPDRLGDFRVMNPAGVPPDVDMHILVPKSAILIPLAVG